MLTCEDESGVQTDCSVAAEMSRRDRLSESKTPLHRQIDRLLLLTLLFSLVSGFLILLPPSPPLFLSQYFILPCPHHLSSLSGHLSPLFLFLVCPRLITFLLTSHPFHRLPHSISTSLLIFPSLLSLPCKPRLHAPSLRSLISKIDQRESVRHSAKMVFFREAPT